MADGTLPPQVDGPLLGRLDVIFGRPAVFPPPLATQSFVFMFKWWGDTQPCILRLPPEKGEARITHRVTCSSHSFRQYLHDMKSLHVSLKIVNGADGDLMDDEHGMGHQVQSPRCNEGDTPRQRLMRRQVRLKKGWQNGDVIGTFILPDLKLNARGDYVHEARILDSLADVVGNVVVTMVFTNGTLEDLTPVKTDESSLHVTGYTEKQNGNNKPKTRTSGIPVPEARTTKTPNTTQLENHTPRSRSGSFRDSFRQKWDKLKSPNKQQYQQQQQQQQQQKQQQQQHQQQQQKVQQQPYPQQQKLQVHNKFGYSKEEKENHAPYRKKTGSFSRVIKEEPTHQEYFEPGKHVGQQVTHQNGQIPVFRYKSQQPTQQDFHVKSSDSCSEQHHEGSQQEKEDYLSSQSQNISESFHWKETQPVTDKVLEGRQQDPKAVVWRDKKGLDVERERPASWGLYPLLNGAEPQSLVESGAVKPEDLPLLLQVLEGSSPELRGLDSKSQKLLDGLDLSYATSSSTSQLKAKLVNQDWEREDKGRKRYLQSVFNKDGQRSGEDFSGVWPLEERKYVSNLEKGRSSPHPQPTDKVLPTTIPKYGSPRRPQQSSLNKTKIPTTHKTRPSDRTYQTHPGRTVSDKKASFLSDGFSSGLRENREALGGGEKGASGKCLSEEEGTLLMMDIGTLTLHSPLLPMALVDKEKKTTGMKVLHRSRVCYLTSLEITLPILEASSIEWQISHTCASRQVIDNEIHYNERALLKLPPVSAMEVLRGHLVIRSVCRRLGERESEEVGGARVSLMEIWQHNGAKIQVPLYGSCSQDDKDSLSRRRGKKNEEQRHEYRPSADLTLSARLVLAFNQVSPLTDKESKRWSSFDSPAEMIKQPMQSAESRHQPPLRIASEKLPSESVPPKLESSTRPHGTSSSTELKNAQYPVTDLCQPTQLSADKKSAGFRDNGGSHSFNSLHLPSHSSPNAKGMKSSMPYPMGRSQVDVVESILRTPYDPRIFPVTEARPYEYQGSLLTGYNEYSGSNNHPVESGGESPCIQTVTDYCADFLNYDNLGWKPDVEREGSCRVHLEIIKGRGLPWLEGPDGNPVSPNSYVRTTVGFLNVLTNVCLESVNPVWSFAADVLLPYSQLAETKGNLILKVHHRMGGESGARLEDPLLGFVSVDATSIWGGHVSLCGWYPLLDLRGTVRGHLKVSLTPHEPPHHITPANLWQPFSIRQHHGHSLVGTHQARHAYPQYSEAQHLPGSSYQNSAVARSVSVIPQYATKSQKQSSNHENTDKEQSGMRMNESFMATQNAEASSHCTSSSQKSAASISSKQSYEALPSSVNEPSGAHVANSDQANDLKNITSSSHVFFQDKRNKKALSCEDTSQQIILPTTVYRDEENIYSNSAMISEDHSRQKGSIIVKAVATQPSTLTQGPTMQNNICNVNPQHQVPEKEDKKGSILIKDSIIMSHFRMQNGKNDEAGKNNDILCGIDPPVRQRVDDSNRDRNCVAENQVIPDSMPAQANKPNSCLKAPGSPSLKAKHVTFAQKLVQHNNDSGTSQAVVWKSNETHQSTEALQATRRETVFSSGLHRNQGWDKRAVELSNNQRRSQANPGESSDLQVVPCREGDTQVVTSTVSTHGSSSLNGYGNSASHDKNKADLIMAFSWMNQSTGCDTPCASFIESKPAMQNRYENGDHFNAGDNKSPVEMKAALSSPKKSRKLRSRLAANLPLS